MPTHLEIFHSNPLKCCGTYSLSLGWESLQTGFAFSHPRRISPIKIGARWVRATPPRERHFEEGIIKHEDVISGAHDHVENEMFKFWLPVPDRNVTFIRWFQCDLIGAVSGHTGGQAYRTEMGWGAWHGLWAVTSDSAVGTAGAPSSRERRPWEWARPVLGTTDTHPQLQLSSDANLTLPSCPFPKNRVCSGSCACLIANSKWGDKSGACNISWQRGIYPFPPRPCSLFHIFLLLSHSIGAC